MSDLTPMSYYLTCENCDTVLEGIGEYSPTYNTLYANPCPKCGDEYHIDNWLDDDDE